MIRSVRTSIAVVLCVLMGTSLAYAQATRTWVSGVGDDVNPCSRTAPCKTFAGAISKTQAGGEISVLDPGGFGAVTINKAITLNGDGNLASILASLVTGIIINVTDTSAGSRVVIRNISINGSGLNQGINGIRVLNGGNVLIDRVTIQNFNQKGILVENGQVVVKDSVITLVKNANPALGIAAHALGTSQISIENSMITFNNVGVQADGTSSIRISNNGFYNLLTAFACSTGTVASAGNNRRGNIGGPGAIPDCAPGMAIVIQ